MTALLRSWAAALGGEVCGNGVLCPSPGHSPRDRSLSVTPSTTTPNGFLVNSFAGDDPIACLDYVRAQLGLPEFRQERPQKPPLGGQGEPVSTAISSVGQSFTRLPHAITASAFASRPPCS